MGLPSPFFAKQNPVRCPPLVLSLSTAVVLQLRYSIPIHAMKSQEQKKNKQHDTNSVEEVKKNVDSIAGN